MVIPPMLSELISSDLRRNMLEIILAQEEAFSIQAIFDAMLQRDVYISKPTVQNFLIMLTRRGFLVEVPADSAKGRGRPTLKFALSK